MTARKHAWEENGKLALFFAYLISDTPLVWTMLIVIYLIVIMTVIMFCTPLLQQSFSYEVSRGAELSWLLLNTALTIKIVKSLVNIFCHD